MIHIGLQLHPQHTTWPELRDTARLIDELGYDSLMTWDHFVPLYGDASGPNFEGWQLLGAWGAITSRVEIGMLVTGNTYRHPAVLANMAATLDHITGGRAILGLGAAWHEGEHAMYGIPFDTPGVRLGKLGEASRLIRSLLDEERTTFRGKHYVITGARCEPRPLRQRLPLLIGGGGERRTLRIAARYSDIWHGFGTPEVIRRKIGILRRHCDDVGRDFAAIMATTGGSVLIRDDANGVDARLREVMRHHRASAPQQPLAGTPDAVAKRLAEHWKAGVRGFIFGLPAPFDRETIERLQSEVRPRLEQLVA
ncbi:MAG: TIGR03560 family F420-dependent LLM class oxidoreductase [Candidatus Limnocylindria bacterium]